MTQLMDPTDCGHAVLLLLTQPRAFRDRGSLIQIRTTMLDALLHLVDEDLKVVHHAATGAAEGGDRVRLGGNVCGKKTAIT